MINTKLNNNSKITASMPELTFIASQSLPLKFTFSAWVLFSDLQWDFIINTIKSNPNMSNEQNVFHGKKKFLPFKEKQKKNKCDSIFSATSK